MTFSADPKYKQSSGIPSVAMFFLKYCKCLHAGVVVCLLFSCETKLHFTQGVVSITQPEILPLKMAMAQRENSNSWIRNNIELDRIVQIETTEKFVMGTFIKRVILYNDTLIILDKDTNTIFIVNAYTGKVYAHINRRGRGPGESRFIIDIAFDEKKEEILIYNDYQNLVYYSLEGKFLKQEKVNEKLYSHVIYNNDNLIFYNHGEGLYYYPYSIDIFNLTNRTWKTLGSSQKVKFNIKFPHPSMVKSKNIWYVPMLDTGLHLLEGDEIMVPYSLDVKNPITVDLLNKYNKSDDYSYFSREVNDRSILYSIHGVKETEKYIIFNTNAGFMMMDKKTFEIHSALWMFDEYTGIIHNSFDYFAHDGDDNRIMFIVSPHQWLERKPTAQNISVHLKEQIDAVTLDLESNPILVFYKEK